MAQPDPWPEDLSASPLVIDTDIGGDADEAMAVAAPDHSQDARRMLVRRHAAGFSPTASRGR
ncbi:hypothetical protein DQ392_01905 [Streptomyces reniochalinae]|uniref:Uncharacterized protein n=1 Tax=Streptomyces reniochalinae TaxID=2250578 RepID=A0A367F4J7_9ACTN|nr:hypothetical protein DQ392_01905 [Streptomyces reniochalinae]